MTLLVAGCLLQATTSTTLMGVTVRATFPGAGSITGAGERPAPLAPGELPPDEESVTWTVGSTTRKVTVRLSNPDDQGSPRELVIDGKDYGHVAAGDVVETTGSAVTVNGVLRAAVESQPPRGPGDRAAE